MSDEQVRALEEGTISAGEIDPDDQPATERRLRFEVVIGKIPDEHDTTSMLWTVRCTDPQHDLLGRFATREEAERSREVHLTNEHPEE